MREIVLDTETTGLDPGAGHRVVEIGCVELINHLPSGEVFHQYLNPERDMPEEAFRVHGLSEEFLAGYPVFAEIAEAFVSFIGEAPSVIHNAAFDMKFLNAELASVGIAALPAERAIDTLALARRRYPRAQASLDMLCKRFGIDNSARTSHGALLDSELLAAVYLELIGGREPGLELASVESRSIASKTARNPVRRAHFRRPRLSWRPMWLFLKSKSRTRSGSPRLTRSRPCYPTGIRRWRRGRVSACTWPRNRLD